MIFIPHNVPSSKNSRINTSKGSFKSAAVRKYLQKVGVAKYSVRDKEVVEYKQRENLFRKAFSKKDITEFKKHKPLVLGYLPVRDSKRSFDLHNCIQIIADLLTAHDFIEDDDADNLIAIPMKDKHTGRYYIIDKNKAGIYLKILNNQIIKY